MTKYRQFMIENEGQKPFTFKVKDGSRFHQTWKGLLTGPVPAPSLTRVSAHILTFRQAGVQIETEMRKQKDEGQKRYGVYHLKSKVPPLPVMAI